MGGAKVSRRASCGSTRRRLTHADSSYLTKCTKSEPSFHINEWMVVSFLPKLLMFADKDCLYGQSSASVRNLYSDNQMDIPFAVELLRSSFECEERVEDRSKIRPLTFWYYSYHSESSIEAQPFTT